MSRPTDKTRQLRQQVERFFADVESRLKQSERRQRQRDKREATRFNVFDLIEPDENRFSDVLALLLDPKGVHGQGDLFLRLFFQQLGIRVAARQIKSARVEREAPMDAILKYRRRMDVVIDAGALVAIENKTDSAEQADQVKDYLKHLRQCRRGRSFPSRLIYLSPDARPPESLGAGQLRQALATGRLQCWSYHRELREWLENCRRECTAQKLRAFLTDLLAYVAVTLNRETQTSP
jgi:hypothetical protein